ncbi:phasin family protein [Sneathiella glossodoripedis]|uniref:phasin family protein n=1 Tax=Sneathiella glossodoripedis TaxID=418853 RepID=UPI0004709B3C|nr:phasin family protein [Sneathiella glossodoripedis]
MSTSSTKKTAAKETNGAEKLEAVKKDMESLFSANRKTLQEAFLSGTEVAENAYKSSSEAFKSTFEKAIKDGKTQVEKAAQSLTEVPMYDKEGAEPFLKAGTAVAEKGEKISVELLEFSAARMDAYFATARSVIEAEDVQKAIELQTEFARSSAEQFVSEASKLNAMFVEASKTLMEPFGAQYAASMDKFLNRA